jgi:hypothetical protein
MAHVPRGAPHMPAAGGWRGRCSVVQGDLTRCQQFEIME